ncbi:MAG: AtpZ/AtpI family protein [Candidatus Eremiobacteraeota bacterium]|nr:AtpZ/AtpI family protein [Candidatus Eremiobacteraeota bacterium]
MAFGATARRHVSGRIFCNVFDGRSGAIAVALIAAGGSFAGAVLLGLLLGIWIGNRTGQPLWVLIGIFGGVAVGGYGAVRLLLRETR